MAFIFGVFFLLYFLKLSSGQGFYALNLCKPGLKVAVVKLSRQNVRRHYLFHLLPLPPVLQHTEIHQAAQLKTFS